MVLMLNIYLGEWCIKVTVDGLIGNIVRGKPSRTMYSTTSSAQCLELMERHTPKAREGLKQEGVRENLWRKNQAPGRRKLRCLKLRTQCYQIIEMRFSSGFKRQSIQMVMRGA
ncbi:hypothetical protein QQ045_008065 [Rhodiola kirilowii]